MSTEALLLETRRRLTWAGAALGWIGAALVTVVAANVHVRGTMNRSEVLRVLFSLLLSAGGVGAALGRVSAGRTEARVIGLSVAACFFTAFPAALTLVISGQALDETPMELGSAAYIAVAGDAYLLPPLLTYGLAVGMALSWLQRRTLSRPVRERARMHALLRIFD